MTKINQIILAIAIIATIILPGTVLASATQSAIMDQVDAKISAATAPLYAQINALQATCKTGNSAEINKLSDRLTILEMNVSFFINNVSNVLTQVMNYLKK
jgi:hypothetical protein